MFTLKLLSKLINILSSAASPNQIAGGFALGMVIGLTPLLTLHNVLVFILIILININIATAIVSFAVFSGAAYLLDPLFHNLGYFMLVDMQSLTDLWTTLYNIPVIALSRYNNTVVLGSLMAALLLFIPLFFSSKLFVGVFRRSLLPKFQQLKIVQLAKGSKIYHLYKRVKEFRG